jgi:hypothetical protein
VKILDFYAVLFLSVLSFGSSDFFMCLYCFSFYASEFDKFVLSFSHFLLASAFPSHIPEKSYHMSYETCLSDSVLNCIFSFSFLLPIAIYTFLFSTMRTALYIIFFLSLFNHTYSFVTYTFSG